MSPRLQIVVPARAELPAENQLQHSDHRKGFKHGKKRDENAATKSRVKVTKLQLSKETIKDLTPGKQKQLQGGKMVEVPETYCRTCSCAR